MTATHGASGYRFDADERAQYDTAGYVFRRNVFEPHEVRGIGEACERLVQDMQQRRHGQRTKAGSYVFEPDAELAMMVKWEGDTDILHGLEPFAHLSPELKSCGLDPRLVDPMKDLCGDESPALFTEKLNLKRPRVGGHNPFHQDYPYWLEITDDPGRLATAMLYLDDATPENGCLEVVPGSHRSGLAKMRTDSDEFGNNEMDPRPFENADLIAVEGPAGSVVFFGSLLVHKSDSNRSDLERRALLYSYGRSTQRHMSEFMAEAITSGRH